MTWLLLVILCGHHTCSIDVDGIFTDRAMCLAEADRMADRYWNVSGFGCQPSPVERLGVEAGELRALPREG